MADTEAVTVDVIAVHKAPVGAKLLALVDVAITIHNIEFVVRGFRVTRETLNGKNATAVVSPLHRGADGSWKSTFSFPPELHDPISDIILNACMDAGVCRVATTET